MYITDVSLEAFLHDVYLYLGLGHGWIHYGRYISTPSAYKVFTCVRAGLYVGLVSFPDNELTFLSAVEKFDHM